MLFSGRLHVRRLHFHVYEGRGAPAAPGACPQKLLFASSELSSASAKRVAAILLDTNVKLSGFRTSRVHFKTRTGGKKKKKKWSFILAASEWFCWPVRELLREHNHITALCDTNKMAFHSFFFSFFFSFFHPISQVHHRNAETVAAEECGCSIFSSGRSAEGAHADVHSGGVCFIKKVS